MKIIPLLEKDITFSDSSKLLVLEKTSDFDFNHIKNFNKINLNCNFSFSTLERLKKINTSCIIIFNDYKLLFSKSKFCLKNVNHYDKYKLIFSIKNKKVITCKSNNSIIFNILNCLFNEYKFFIENNLNNNILVKVVQILNIFIEYKKLNNNPIDEIYIDQNINNLYLFLENYVNKILSIDELNKILKTLSYIKNNKYDDYSLNLFNNILNAAKEIEWEDSLVKELLGMTSESNYPSHDFNNLSKLITLDKKSKYLINKLKLENIPQKSTELYSSVITRTNWVEELEYGNIMGILLNIDPKEINKSAYNLDYIPIKEITHTIIGFDQIMEAYKLDTTDNEYENVMSGYGVGEGNCILPLYINKDHWKFVDLYFNYNLGIIFNRNSLQCSFNHRNVYKNVLNKMINLTFSDDNYKSEKWINLLFSVLRTNYEIFKDDKNIYINKFIKDKKFRVTCNLNNILMEYLFSKGHGHGHEINLIFEELIRRTFKSLYKSIDILDDIYDFNIISALNYECDHKNNVNLNLINIENFNNWVSNLELNSIFSEKITLIYAIIMMKKIINKKDFFNTFDNNSGVLSKDNLDIIKEFINNKSIKPENCELFGLLNPKFKEHVNFTKDKIFSVNTFIKLNLVENDIQLHNIFIQSLIQRVDKSRKRAIDGNKTENPFSDNNIIKNTGLLIAQRYIKKYYDLLDSQFNYFSVINTIDIELLELFIETMIQKTISIKSYILNAVCNITNDERKETVLKLLK